MFYSECNLFCSNITYPVAGGFFCEKYIYFVLPSPKWDYHSSLLLLFFFPKMKQTESKMVWYAYRSWATTIEGVRYLLIMSNFKWGEIKENIDLVHNNVVTSLVVCCLNRAFDRLWAFRILFLEIRTGFSFWKKKIFFKSRISN